MPTEDKQEPQTEELSPQIQEVMRNLVSAMRAVKLYPPNNPVYAQTVRKAFDSLDGYLQSAPLYPVGIQKSFFLFQQTPVAKDTQINKSIAQDLFAKGIRELVFQSGLSEQELLDLFQALSLSSEELALRGGIISILWEKGATHIKVTESSLDEVITTTEKEDMVQKALAEPAIARLHEKVAKQEFIFAGRTLVLGDMVEDPRKFGAQMLEVARESLQQGETVEDRLQALYHEAAEQIKKQEPEQSEALFQGLAKSVLAMEPEHRDRFITTKLYEALDSEHVRAMDESVGNHLPGELHEIVTGRYAKEWTVKQVSTLLKKTTAPKARPVLPPVSPDALPVAPVPGDIFELARQVQEYTASEMDAMKEIGEAGMEADIIEATVRTLIFLLPHVSNPHRHATPEKDLSLFSGVVHQLEDIQAYLLKIRDFDLANLVTRAFHVPVDANFQPRLNEALRKSASRDVIKKLVQELYKEAKETPQYHAAYSYLAALEREVTPVLLELLAEEKDRSNRRHLLELLKDLGKNQMELLGERLNDERWYFVRNIVNIIGESKTEHSVSFLEKVSGHKNHQIRLEVVKGLLGIGGKKAAALLVRFLQDADDDIRLLAVRGLGLMHGVGRDELSALTAFVKECVKRKPDELTLEGIRSLGKIGSGDTQLFLQPYLKIKWWRARKPQEELRDACQAAINDIQRRIDSAGKSA